MYDFKGESFNILHFRSVLAAKPAQICQTRVTVLSPLSSKCPEEFYLQQMNLSLCEKCMPERIESIITSAMFPGISFQPGAQPENSL